MLWHGKNFRGIINKAKEMIFNNTGTDLISTNAEDAIKEVNSKLIRKRAEGTTLASLLSTIYPLTIEEYIRAHVRINGIQVCYPVDYTSRTFQLMTYSGDSSTAYIMYSIWTETGTNGRCSKLTKSINGSYTKIDETITSWELYY